MSKRILKTSTQTGFFLLIVSQSLHSIEEYSYALWEVFAPARFVSGLISDNLRTGFVTINITLVALGFCCYFGPVLSSWAGARFIIGFWIVLELGNSISHSYIAISTAGYFPGLYTTPLLLICSCYLAYSLIGESRSSA